MADRIPITTAKEIAQKHGYDQVIIYARRPDGDGLEWVTTYGKNPTHCKAAARIGAALRDYVTPTLARLCNALSAMVEAFGHVRIAPTAKQETAIALGRAALDER